MKKIFLFVLLSLGLTAMSFADTDDYWQDLDLNINKLNERSTSSKLYKQIHQFN